MKENPIIQGFIQQILAKNAAKEQSAIHSEPRREDIRRIRKAESVNRARFIQSRNVDSVNDLLELAGTVSESHVENIRSWLRELANGRKGFSVLDCMALSHASSSSQREMLSIASAIAETDDSKPGRLEKFLMISPSFGDSPSEEGEGSSPSPSNDPPKFNLTDD